MVTIGRGERAAVEVTTSLANSPRLDQITALDQLLEDAEQGAIRPTDGLRRLAVIHQLQPCFGQLQGAAVFGAFACFSWQLALG